MPKPARWCRAGFLVELSEQYAAVHEAAAEEGVKVATYCREAILARAMPEPEFPDVATLPAWLLHFLIFFTKGKTKPV